VREFPVIQQTKLDEGGIDLAAVARRNNPDLQS
jgi:hypothetical protein